MGQNEAIPANLENQTRSFSQARTAACPGGSAGVTWVASYASTWWANVCAVDMSCGIRGLQRPDALPSAREDRGLLLMICEREPIDAFARCQRYMPADPLRLALSNFPQRKRKT